MTSATFNITVRLWPWWRALCWIPALTGWMPPKSWFIRSVR